MHTIVEKRTLAPKVTLHRVLAPEIARSRKPGQFVMLRIYEQGERFPLTIADADPSAGTITLISQEVGKSTALLARLGVGDSVLDVAGPLGRPTHIERFGTAICVGGGIGIAPLYPIAKALKDAGNRVITILGARTQDLLILEQEMRAASHALYVCTDDGSYGFKGFVSQQLQDLIDQGLKADVVFAVGPVPMMKAVCAVTKPHGILTIVSLNPVMVDGTGMCGGCRVTVGGQTKFVCVDGPEFDGHEVDFDELVQRQQTYRPFEEQSCKLITAAS
ncbi:MAG: sulfide/dihydroorotate dehydrogenase-like FAD/NAD-binding protein [Armatimonadota bacterium]